MMTHSAADPSRVDLSDNKKINIIVTGASGMVGEGVLRSCLQRDEVAQVLVVGRKPCGISHAKLREIIHSDFFALAAIESQLGGYDACLFCLGVSSLGMTEAQYYQLTYALTLNFANAVIKQNPALTFCYISGAGTDRTEQGRSMWARVKGRTENALLKMPFKRAYNFRPGALEPMQGAQHTQRYYRYVAWLFPLARKVAPNSICKLEELGMAMINAVIYGDEKSTLEVRDIVALGRVNTV